MAEQKPIISIAHGAKRFNHAHETQHIRKEKIMALLHGACPSDALL